MKYDNLYMDIAERISQESYAKRLKVGAAILTENGGLFCGFNGTLPGFVNTCEKEDGHSI
jgi:deoxycytidylate deaminase